MTMQNTINVYVGMQIILSNHFFFVLIGVCFNTEVHFNEKARELIVIDPCYLLVPWTF